MKGAIVMVCCAVSPVCHRFGMDLTSSVWYKLMFVIVFVSAYLKPVGIAIPEWKELSLPSFVYTHLKTHQWESKLVHSSFLICDNSTYPQVAL